MRKIYLLLVVAIIYSCGDKTPKTPQATNSEDPNFEEFKGRLVEELWQNNPVWASYEGYHEFDELLPAQTEEQKDLTFSFWKEMESQLGTIDPKQLSKNNLIDYYLIRDKINSSLFYLAEYNEEQWNPASYNIGGAFFQVINYREIPLQERLQKISIKLDQVNDYYQAAMQNIESPTLVHTELAIQQLNGSISVFETTLMDSLFAAEMDPAFNNDFENKLQEAIQSIRQFVEFLENEVQPTLAENAKSFRLGKIMFEEKFKHDIQSDYSAEEIYQLAQEEKSKLHEKMFQTAEILWDKYYPKSKKPENKLAEIRMVIEAVSKSHVNRANFIKSIRKQIPELESFVQEKGLITLDPEKALVVRETPEYMRGFAGASISAPGPYDKEAETYYNVTPLDHYSDEEAESYLKEYNQYTLQILNIHEAVPGHYTQLVYSNQSPSIIKSIFGNGAMIEGWAVYAEMMMLENGYGNGSPEMDLMYYKWNLRTVCNTILDYGIHVENLSEEKAMDLLVNQAFQEKSEADGKWRRARLSQVQLCSYFTGFYEIRALREEIKTRLGDQFDLKSFHEEFLSYGSAPVKYIRQLMLKNIDEKEALV